MHAGAQLGMQLGISTQHDAVLDVGYQSFPLFGSRFTTMISHAQPRETSTWNRLRPRRLSATFISPFSRAPNLLRGLRHCE
jgi:hypothetical protein